MTRPDRIMFLDVPFMARTQDELVEELANHPGDAAFDYLVTPNVDHVIRLHDRDAPDHAAIVDAYRAARWCICDSRILSRLARLDGLVLPVVTGADLTPALLDALDAQAERRTVLVVGGDEATLPLLARRYPRIAFDQIAPPMGLRRSPEIMAGVARDAARRRASVTLLAVGSPQQELLARQMALQPESGGVALCIGAACDFIVGRVRRAPAIVQKMGMEWLFRLLSDPARLWKRYLVTGPRIFLLFARRRGQSG